MIEQKSAVKTLLPIFTFVGLLLLFTAFAHCTTTSKSNGLGVVLNDIDPNISLIGTIMSGDIIQDDDGREGTNIRVHPKYTYGLFDESVLFCGFEGDRLSEDNKMLAGNRIFTYRRAASRLIRGVPCHQLIGVDKVIERKGL
jgi:hypothetical protein